MVNGVAMFGYAVLFFYENISNGNSYRFYSVIVLNTKIWYNNLYAIIQKAGDEV